MSDEDIKRKIKDFPSPEYPLELLTATRAEFVTRVRTNQPKKPGCPLFTLMVLGVIRWVVYSFLN